MTVWTEIKRGAIPAFAASDIVANTIVTEVVGSDRAVRMVASSNDQPLGVARDDVAYVGYSNPAGQNAVTVYDIGNEKLVTAGASITAGQFVGVSGFASQVHPISKAIVSYPTYGPITGTASSAVWALGQARSTAATGAQCVVRIDPRQLSGLT